ncbi:hypothetical protein BJX64DRAFT_263563 [Aspergillus heterothallicus]
MAYRRESFSSTSTSSSSSTFSSLSATARTQHPRTRKRGSSPTQKLRLKRWLSSHLSTTARQPSNSTTATTSTTNTTTNTLVNNPNHPTTITDRKRTPKSSAEHSHSQSSSSSSLEVKPPHHHDPNYILPNSNPDYGPAEYNPALLYNSNYNNSRDERTIHIHTEYTSPNDPLSDSYAAYCRAFTSSPSPEHLQRQKRTPLPRLPASTDTPDDALEIETPEIERTEMNLTSSAAAEHYAALPPGGFGQPGEPFAIGSTIASAAEATSATATSAASAPAIRFLPVGAHGYLPATWALPRPPTPPPGILTPARYEEMQRRAEEEERERKDKKREEGGLLTWCLPIRMSWAPWGRPKEP